MGRRRSARVGDHCLTALALLLAAAAAASCSRPARQQRATLPISTASAAARSAFLTGRDLMEKQRTTDARKHFLAATEADPEFALGYYGLALTAPTPKDFVAAVESASRVVGSASKGEVLLIKATAAQANNDSTRQLEILQKLLGLFPDDERVLYLVGAAHYGRQEWDEASRHLRRAVEISPSYSPAHNLLGYVLRFLGRYDDAAEAFRRYIELIPDEPNPYDSYGELLMKMGRFHESIASYGRALDLDPNFAPSYIGQGNNYIFLDRPEEARKCFAKLAFIARNDGERRGALAWTAASYVHEGNHVGALAAVQKAMEVARNADDRIALASDLSLCGNILLDAGRPDEAMVRYDESVAMMASAVVSDEVKEAARRTHLFDQAQVALTRGDSARASELAERYRAAVESDGSEHEARRVQELLGKISLAGCQYSQAVAHLDQADQQDPMVWLLKAKARAGLSDRSGAIAACTRAANHNALDFSYAFVRRRALRLLEKLDRGPAKTPATQPLPSPGQSGRSGRPGFGAPWRSASIISLRS